MIIKVAETAGFCFGVRNAVKTAENIRHEASKKGETGNVYTYGPLIHNEQAIKDLEEQGIYAVEDLKEMPDNATVVIRAHGIGRQEEEALLQKAGKVIDATCPNVKKIHRIAASFEKTGDNCFVILGNPDHPEIRGIKGWCEEPPRIYRDLVQLKADPPEERKLTVAAQTTFNRVLFGEIIEYLRDSGYQLDIRHTICAATMQHQKEAMEMAAESDAMIVIGSRNSSNTGKLTELCKRSCPRTYFAQTAADLDGICMEPSVSSIGITAGASTPDRIIREVADKAAALWGKEQK